MLTVKFRVKSTVLKFSKVHSLGKITVGLASISVLLLKADTSSHSRGNTEQTERMVRYR